MLSALVIAGVLPCVYLLPIITPVSLGADADASSALPTALREVGVIRRVFMSMRTMGRNAIPFRKRIPSASLLCHVSRVVGLGAEEQVRRIHAGRVVAPVTNTEPVGDCPEVELPRYTMGRESRRMTPPTRRDTSIAFAPRAHPYPTIARLIDLLPETFSERFHSSNITGVLA